MIFVASSHARISGDRGLPQTRPPILPPGSRRVNDWVTPGAEGTPGAQAAGLQAAPGGSRRLQAAQAGSGRLQAERAGRDIGYPGLLHGADGDSCRCGGQERPGMVRARGYAQRTRSPRSRRKNGASPHPSGWGRGTPAGSGIRRPAGRGLVEPAAEPNREGRETGLQAPIAAKEGGTAGQPPASLVPPAKPYRLGPATGDLADDNPGEAAHMPRPDETEAGVSQPTAPSASATPEMLPS